jgi:hypothetical protein
MCLKPRKVNDSGFPSPRSSRFERGEARDGFAGFRDDDLLARSGFVQESGEVRFRGADGDLFPERLRLDFCERV